jgi:prevent-host-death family protein
VKHVIKKNRLVLLTSRGRGVAVIQSVADYEKTVNPFCTNSSICHFR